MCYGIYSTVYVGRSVMSRSTQYIRFSGLLYNGLYPGIQLSRGGKHRLRRSKTYGEQQQHGSKRHSLQAVELSQRTHDAVQIVTNFPAPCPRTYTRWTITPVPNTPRTYTHQNYQKRNIGNKMIHIGKLKCIY